MKRAAALLACLALAASPAEAGIFGGSGYPEKGKAIDVLKPASDYSDLSGGRPRALGIMRARAQGFVPSPELHTYLQGVLMRVLAGEALPPSFHADVRVLAAPEFTALCTPDGTVIVTVGLLELMENEDELAFILAHEASHAILRHHDSDWFKRSQYFAVTNGAAVDDISKNASFQIGGFSTSDIGAGYRAAKSLYRLSSNVLVPQYEQGQEDEADALGFDLMVKAGYDPAAALSVLDKLAEQEAIANAAAEAAKKDADKRAKAEKKAGGSSNGLFGGLVGGALSVAGIGGGGGGASNFGAWAGLAAAALDAVNDLAGEATSHHPATERAELISNYQFREYRDLLPGHPRPLAWSPDSKAPGARAMTELLAHYGAAEDAASYVADTRSGVARSDAAKARAAVARSTAVPTNNHAYTEYAAAEYYSLAKEDAQTEGALLRATQGPEPSWEVYSRLTDIYLARKDYARADALMTEATGRFDDSPVLLPKRIEVLHAMGRQKDAEALLPKCKGFDIDELDAQCKKAAGKS